MENTLPKNWVETEFQNLADFVIGGDWGKDEDFEDENFSLVHCIRGSEIKNWNREFGATAILRKLKLSSIETRALINGDILLEISGGGPDQPVGRCVLINDKVFKALPNHQIVCTNFLRLIRPTKKINSSYLNNFLQKFYLSGEIINYQGGSNNLRNLKYKEFETIKIPLPPLPEQERIVAKLDALFAQHERMKQALDKIPQLLKNFRQQVLSQAVTGKLTEQWREGKELESGEIFIQNIINDRNSNDTSLKKKIIYKSIDGTFELPINWSFSYLQNLGEFTRGKSKHRPRNDKKLFGGSYPFIQTGDVSNANMYINEYKNTYSDFGFNQSRLFPKGTLCITIAANIAETAILNFDACFPDSVVGYVPYKNLYSSEFAMYFINTIQKELEQYAPATAQKNINMAILTEIPFPIPPLVEQQEIVSRVESLFAKADAIEVRYQKLKEKIEALPQVLLHKAFKGELTEQLESDGTAKDLLEEIAALKSGGKPKKVVSKKYTQPDDEVLRLVAESPSYPILSPRDKKVQRKMLAVHIVNQSLEDQSFGKTKFEKLLHLVECHVLKRDLNQNYSVQAAGPYDGGFTKSFWDDVLKSKWFAIKEQGSLKRIVGGENQNKSVKEYGYFSDEEKQKINDFIEIFSYSNYEKPEIVSTLYAVWNNRIKRNEPINDDFLKEDFLNWDPGKAKYKDRLDKALQWMRTNDVVPNGWGKEIKIANTKSYKS